MLPTVANVARAARGRVRAHSFATAAVCTSLGGALEYQRDAARPLVGRNQVRIKVAAGVCQSAGSPWLFAEM
eukprot:5211853-Prymnesium_polylepis.1